MYYLSLIGKELSATPEEDEPGILSTHPRYSELCDLYGEPTIARAVAADGSGKRTVHPRTVAARLIKMAFRLSNSSSSTGSEKEKFNESNAPGHVKEIPASFDSYQVKALVSRLFNLPAYGFKLFWETDEFDPVEKDVSEEGVIDSDGDSEDEMQMRQRGSSEPNASRFARREVELVDSTRDIGFLFQGETGQMRIRVEVPPV